MRRPCLPPPPPPFKQPFFLLSLPPSLPRLLGQRSISFLYTVVVLGGRWLGRKGNFLAGSQQMVFYIYIYKGRIECILEFSFGSFSPEKKSGTL